MKELIKQIRKYTSLSQMEFAAKLGVQFATINRWENGHSEPTYLAQETLVSFCKELNIPTYEIVMSNINKEINEVNVGVDRTALYHGSKSDLKGDIAPISRNRCDFGQGFYMGTLPEQALMLICDYEESVFYVMSIDLNNLKTVMVPPDIDWAMLVAFHRGKMDKIKESDFYKKYSRMTSFADLIIGNIADDRMFFVIDEFFRGNITDTALINALSVLQLGNQYVAITDKACRAIKIEKELRLSHFEKKVLQDYSEINRQKGIELANQICKKYRREGKYFDEILDEAVR